MAVPLQPFRAVSVAADRPRLGQEEKMGSRPQAIAEAAAGALPVEVQLAEGAEKPS